MKVRITDDQRKALEEEAARRGLTPSETLRIAIDEFLYGGELLKSLQQRVASLERWRVSLERAETK